MITAHYRTILNAIPIPAFVVDSDARILDMNDAAAHFCDQKRETIYKRRSGEVLHCPHSTDVPEGCGRGPFCNNCVIRNSLAKCFKGRAISRKVMRLQLADGQGTNDLQVLITTSPMPDSDETLALVMVEDITDRQKPVYNISPTTPLKNSQNVEQRIDWQPRPWTLRDFPEATQDRLRQLDFNRTITVCVGDKALYIKRVGFNRFLCSDA